MARLIRVSEWNRIKGFYALGRKVAAVVVRRVGLGVLCRVGGDRAAAVVRNREMAWAVQDQRNDLLAEGEEFEAVVLRHDNDRRELELSKKAADPNPLASFHSRHPDGTDVEGQVHRVLDSGDLVVALDGGIEGLMPRHTLPAVKASDDMAGGWELKVGDWVRGRKTGVNFVSGQVKLNGEVARLAAEEEFAHQTTDPTWGRTAPPPPPPPPPPAPALGLVVLLVEDEDDIREPAELYLRLRGHTVHSAGGLAAGLRLVESAARLDAAVVDMQLGGQTAGPLLERIRERFPACRLLVLTGNPSAVRPAHERLIDGLLPKPLAAPDLVAVVEGASAGHRPAVFDEGVGGLLGSEGADEAVPSTARDLVDAHLRAVLDLYPRGKVALLARDDARTEVRCVRAAGGPAEPFARYARHLTASPVEDVLGDGTPVRFVRGRGVEPQGFAAFLTWLGARTMIGLPVAAEAVPLPLGVFVFLPTDDVGDADTLTRLQVRVDALAVALDRAVLNAQLLQNQRAMSAGGLFLGITHELANGVNAVINQLGVVGTTLDGQLPYPHAKAGVDTALAAAHRLMRTFHDLLATVRPRDATPLPLGEVLGRVKATVRGTATHHAVGLSWPPADRRAADVRVPAAVEQAVLNLVLNAVQHTAAYRRANHLANGLVTVSATHETDDGEWAVVRVTDNGPGIDGAAFDRVFAMYHTTRLRGSGLGLYVARSVVRSGGGEVSVERSVKFIETTFSVRMPIR